LLGKVCFLIPVASLESRAKNQESRPKSLLIFLFSFIFRASTVLFCCLLFQFTSSNMSKNVFSVCSYRFAVCS
jgi:hypothetical protein